LVGLLFASFDMYAADLANSGTPLWRCTWDEPRLVSFLVWSRSAAKPQTSLFCEWGAAGSGPGGAFVPRTWPPLPTPRAAAAKNGSGSQLPPVLALLLLLLAPPHYHTHSQLLTQISRLRLPVCSMAGLAINPVQGFRTLRVLHWEFLRLWTGFELPSSWPDLPWNGLDLNRSGLDFMKWPHIGLGAQDLNDIQRPKYFPKIAGSTVLDKYYNSYLRK
jgi:hypothetical protein